MRLSYKEVTMKNIMKNILLAFTGFLAIASFTSHAANYKRDDATCFPLSKIKYEAGVKSASGLSEYDFNQTIDRVHALMSLEIKRRMNKELIFERKWADGTVDAFATRDDINNPVIVVHGGLARHPEMTKDGFALILCHEVGHHLGGAPKIFRGTSGLRGWSSAEGQADYFATTKCLPIIFQNYPDTKSYEIDSDATELSAAMNKCRDTACTRTVLAGLAVSKVFASMVKGTPDPSLLLNDPTKVSVTLYKHPNPQCRLDTYLSGANCDIGIDVPFDIVDPKVGACVKDQGYRPACWFSEDEFVITK